MSLIEKIYAVDVPEITPVEGSGVENVAGLIEVIVTFLSYIVGGLAFIYLVYAGILYITANGNPEQAKKGQTGIINAIIGIIIVILALVIINVVKGTTEDAVTLLFPLTTIA